MIGHTVVVRAVVSVGVAGLAGIQVARTRRAGQQPPLVPMALTALAAVSVALLLVVWLNHLRFPANLETMENVILQHVQRAAHGLPIYPQPGPTFAALAYNPAYYYLSVPFTWVFGSTLATLRGVAILGMIVAGAVMFVAVRRRTGSTWWALLTVGLFAIAYRVMDSALDNAHCDSWLLAMILLGTEILDRSTTRSGRVAGILVLVLGFWFKQHGALFAIGGATFLTWQLGVRRSWPYWLLAALAGGGVYVYLGPWLFGPYFHYFTWTVPGGWTVITPSMLTRIGWLILASYPFLFLGATGETAWSFARAARRGPSPGAWEVQYVIAFLSAFMGALDDGSSDNVFIPFGGVLLVVGTIGLWHWWSTRGAERTRVWTLAAVGWSFALLLYNPTDVLLSRRAPVAYADFLNVVRGLDGTVMAPSVGQIPDGPTLYPGVTWVATEDMVRGHSRTPRDTALAWGTISPAAHPRGPAYIFAGWIVGAGHGPVQMLKPCYTLVQDFGDRFIDLHSPAKRYLLDWPRYLYRYQAGSPDCHDPSNLRTVSAASPN